MLPTPLADGLIQQDPLDRGILGQEQRPEAVIVERGVERVARDVRHLAGYGREVGSEAAGCGIRRRLEGVEGERAERPLIGEDQRELAVLRVIEVHAHALVPLGRRTGRTQQQLSAHAEVTDDRIDRLATGGRLEREPEELASARRRTDPPPGQGRLEVRAVALVPGQGTLVEHGHSGDRGAGDRGGEPGADHFDLGKLRHAR